MKTTFGGLLTSFQKQRKVALELAREQLTRRHKGKPHTKIVETKIVTHNGDTVYSLEMWQKIDETHLKFSADVRSEELKPTSSSDLNELMK